MIFANKQVNKVALVTGSARRIGHAIVKALHETNFDVVIHYYQSHSEAQALVAHLNEKRTNSACAIESNLTDAKQAALLISLATNWRSRLDLLINNASLFLPSDGHDFNLKAWQNLFNLNVRAPFILSHSAFPWLKRESGNIINITDIHAQTPLTGYSAYCQSKAALLMQTKALAQELAPFVRVNAIAPGAIAWPEGENALSPAIKAHIVAKIPLRRSGTCAHITQAVSALINNDYITGHTLTVDGGRHIKG